MILYTSGTTGKPKGVVSTHANLCAQVTSLVAAWDWRADDRILLVLPLHHVHGIVNVLSCALWSGARCDMLPKFDAGETWRRIARGDLTLFMAVPTIYHKLIAAWDAAGERRPGFVGTSLPGVEVRLVDADGTPVGPGTPGELEVRGSGVFLEYWRRPDATATAFRSGWFRTGDVAVLENGSYRILGRSSVDIIKTGGYKISALEIEEVLRTHAAVAECAVVGVEDAEWGERVCAAVELVPGSQLTLPELQAWAKQRLAPYKVPRALSVVDALPRNALGKVVKPEVGKLFRGVSGVSP